MVWFSSINGKTEIKDVTMYSQRISEGWGDDIDFKGKKTNSIF